jgi:hypothetical protein
MADQDQAGIQQVQIRGQSQVLIPSERWGFFIAIAENISRPNFILTIGRFSYILNSQTQSVDDIHRRFVRVSSFSRIVFRISARETRSSGSYCRIEPSGRPRGCHPHA